jgi:hypothetical protein
VNVTVGRTVYKNAECPESSGWGVATLLRERIAKDVKTRGGEGKDLTIRTLYLPALIVAAVLLACAAALLALSEKAQAVFPGKNGKIAYEFYGGGTDRGIYTINPGGGGKTKVRMEGTQPAYSPNGKRIAYAEDDGHDLEIYTIKAGGGDKFKVTNNDEHDEDPSYSPDGKKIAYSGDNRLSDGDVYSEIYTINVGGGNKSQVTDTKHIASNPSWGSRP